MAFTDQLTVDGLELMTLEERIAELESALKSDIDPSLDTRAGSIMGQFVRINAERIQSVLELSQALYSGFDPDASTGFMFTGLSSLTGTTRNAATFSILLSTEATVNLNAGVTLPQGKVAHVSGDPTSRFVTDVAVTNSGGAAANIDCAFTAESSGAVQCLSGALTVIAEPYTGWNSVTNSADATEGEPEETDTELRIRRESELQTGSTAVGAVLTALTQTTGIVWASVLENDTDYADTNGLPPHSIHAIVHAPTLTDATIAGVVYAAKSAGIQADGVTVVSVTDTQGNDHNVGFTSATVTDIDIAITLTYTDGDYAGDTAVKAALVAWGDSFIGVGDPLYRAQLVDVTMGIEGVVNVDFATLTIEASASDYATDWDELPELDTTRITVTSTAV